jgi:hypothetical protein
MMSRDLVVRVRWLIAWGIGLLVLVGPARAHPRGRYLLGGWEVGFPAVVGCSVAVCLLAGVVTVRNRRRISEYVSRDVSRLLAGLFVLLGLSCLLPAALGEPVVASVAGVVTVVGLHSLENRSEHVTDHHASMGLGAIASHRAIEGSLLAALYLSNVALGVLGAVVLTVHATLETVAVASAYWSRTPQRAVGAVILVQLSFVGGAMLGRVTTVTLPEMIQQVTLAVVGVTLVVLGVSRVRS